MQEPCEHDDTRPQHDSHVRDIEDPGSNRIDAHVQEIDDAAVAEAIDAAAAKLAISSRRKR